MGRRKMLEIFCYGRFFHFCFTFICAHGGKVSVFPLRSTALNGVSLKIEKVFYGAFMNMRVNERILLCEILLTRELLLDTKLTWGSVWLGLIGTMRVDGK